MVLFQKMRLIFPTFILSFFVLYLYIYNFSRSIRSRNEIVFTAGEDKQRYPVASFDLFNISIQEVATNNSSFPNFTQINTKHHKKVWEKYLHLP